MGYIAIERELKIYDKVEYMWFAVYSAVILRPPEI